MFYGVIRESSLKSNIDKDYKSKGKKNLGSFSMIKANKDFINNNKKQYSMFKHIDYKDTVCVWKDKDNIVAVLAVDPVDHGDKKIWITALEIVADYQGYGLSKQILKYAVDTLKATALTVNKENKVAIKIYEDFGFKKSPKSNKDSAVYYMYYRG